MNIKPLVKYFPKDSLLSALPAEILDISCRYYIECKILNDCRLVSKGFKLLIEEKKLLEYHLSQDGPLKKKLLYSFYEDNPPSLWLLLKNGIPLPHLRKFITEDLIVIEKEYFFKCLSDEFIPSYCFDDLSSREKILLKKQEAIIKFCFFAQHPDEKLHTKARECLQLLQNGYKINHDQRKFIQTACEKIDTPILLSIRDSFICFGVFEARRFLTLLPDIFLPVLASGAFVFLGVAANLGGITKRDVGVFVAISVLALHTSVYLFLLVVSILNISPISALIEQLRIYIQYGHWQLSVYNDLARLIPFSLTVLTCFLFF